MTKSRTNEKVAFIGFGLSGLAEFCSYVDRAIRNQQKPSIIIFEKNENNFAKGLPYSSGSPAVWNLNGPKAELFKVPNDGISLKTWMEENKQVWQDKFPNIDQDYPPRALVGEYLKAQYKVYEQKAIASGIQIETHFEEVLDLEISKDDQFRLHTSHQQVLADFVGLGLGHLSQDTFQHLIGKPNFISNPWDPNQLAKLPKNAEKIVVIGGHLTFIDVAKYLSLVHQFQGKIVSVTRHPSMIVMRDNPFEPCQSQLSELQTIFASHKEQKISFQQARTLFWETYAKSVKKPIQPKINTRYALSTQLASLEKSDQLDLSLGSVDEIHGFVQTFFTEGCYNAMWEALDENGKEEFSKQFYSMIIAYLVGIPPSVARFLKEMYDANRIQEQAGLVDLKFDETTQAYYLKFSNGDEMQANYVVNATGPGRDIKKHFKEFPLLEKMYQKEMITLTQYGGIITNEHNQAINANGQPISNLIALGPSVFKGKISPEASFAIAPAADHAIEEHFRMRPT